ncbi:MAG: hydroxypyruvate isomerase family protein, partial [Longimicrobiales bacterium]
PGAAPAAGSAAAAGPAGTAALKQSVCKWPFREMSVDELAAAARDVGLVSIELIGPNDWPIVQEYGLTCAVAGAPGRAGNMTRGFNRLEDHEWLLPAYETILQRAADAGVPSVLCFSGNRGGDLSDADGLENCARGLSQLTPLAERVGVTLVIELLNSKIDHPDYQCDSTPWGVALVEKVGSQRLKLLYDIYHMQIMEGDVIRTIRDNHQYIAHYHTAGVPGRHELDESQELFYPAIMRAIKETGYQGYIGQEFIPTGDPIASLAEAVRVCNV